MSATGMSGTGTRGASQNSGVLPRLVAALRLDLRLQVRYRFLHAAVFSAVLWLALLLPIPEPYRSMVEPFAIFGDIAIIGFFFIAGSVFFEKGERTLSAITASPLRFVEYLTAKLVTLIGLSLVLGVAVVVICHGFGFNLGLMVVGTALASLVLLLTGLVSALPFRSVSDWFMFAVAPLAIMMLPIFDYAGIWVSPLFAVVPTYGPLYVIGIAFGQKEWDLWQYGYAVLYPLLFSVGLCLLAKWQFNKYVIARTGSE